MRARACRRAHTLTRTTHAQGRIHGHVDQPVDSRDTRTDKGEETGKGKAGELTGGAEGGHQSHDDATELHARGSLTTVGTGRQEERDRHDARIETTQTDTSPVTSRSFSATASHSLSAFLTSATSLGASPTIPEVVLSLHVGIGVGRGVER